MYSVYIILKCQSHLIKLSIWRFSNVQLASKDILNAYWVPDIILGSNNVVLKKNKPKC